MTLSASLQWLQQQRHVSHIQACWLNLLAEYQYRVVHNPGSTRAGVARGEDSESELNLMLPM